MHTLFEIYNVNKEVPGIISELIKTEAMTRLKDIGMNCGCEYTSFPQFKNIGPYSRFSHSLGAALIVWNFTGETNQAVAALFHDISTPVFAHTIDFMYGDYMSQEYTEKSTESVIRASSGILEILDRHCVDVADVCDYHRYPVADNSSPKLSADRLEYTIGNMINYGLATFDEAKRLYDDLSVEITEDGSDELVFSSLDDAERFAFLSLECSKIYVSDADRYSMQMLSEITARAIAKGVISTGDLYTDENNVISKFKSDEEISRMWSGYCSMSEVLRDENARDDRARIIDAKKRFIDPYVSGRGRVSTLCGQYRDALGTFLDTSFSYPVSAK